MRRAVAFPVALALLALAPRARAQVTVAVDPTMDAHVISPLIYGLNFPSDAQIAKAGVTVGRWGGNSTTRYNYQIDVRNTAADYYFENIAGCWTGCAGNPPADPQDQSSANAFLAGLASKGVVALFTIPTIGWVPKGPPAYNQPLPCSCGGVGDQFDPNDGQCGNGQITHMDMSVTYLDCPNAVAVHQAVDPTWTKTWVQYLVSKFGPANGKRIYALDNEPALWSSTHHDLRKTRLGYDELWQRMRDTAVAILEADPTAEIAGPAEWGWPNYFCSDADDVSKGCSATSPDRAAHGGTDLLSWLLDQAKTYEQQHGKRILHYLDLHYYPQGGSPPDVTRSLWDKTYTDPSWINDTIYLLPRMRDWVAQHYPGTKVAISEYDFYSHADPVGAVTYAEVLGLFGREGVDLATAWSPPDPSEAAFAAYALYRNYDGNGGAFESVSARAAVTGTGVQAYAATGPTRLTVVLVNELGASADVDVTFGNFAAGASGSVFQHAGSGSAVTKQPDVTVQAGKAHLTLPGTSITLLSVDGKNPNELPDAGGTTSASSGAAGSTSGGGGAGGSSATSGSGSGGSPGRHVGKAGCGCRVASASDPGGAWAATAALALALGAARRRRR